MHHEEPHDRDARPEALIRTPESDSRAAGRADDEDLGLRVDTGEWQEYPSPNAEPAEPESVAERMAGPDSEEGAPTEADAGTPGESRAPR